MSRPERLAVFDVDGTLCDTVEIDLECFLGAVGSVYGDRASALDLQDAPHITDAGILHWISLSIRSRPPMENEVTAVKRAFVKQLSDARRADPKRFREVPGARRMIEQLRGEGWDVVAATGGWRAPTLLKLAAARIADKLLAASSDDSCERAQVFSLAIQRAREDEEARRKVVLVGDGTWDLATATALGTGFIGVGSGERARRLRQAGAGVVLPDYQDLGRAMQTLRAAACPARTKDLRRSVS